MIRAVVLSALVLAIPSLAFAQAGGAGGFAASDAPIEIAADELEVRQEEGLAIFTGNVDAVQGDLRLTADQLDVLYGSGGLEGDGDIERVIARGNVVVRSQEDVARGDEGVYDLASQQITLTGDVVLTRGANVLRGNRLDVDLASGVSRMRAAGRDGRVRAVFDNEADGDSR